MTTVTLQQAFEACQTNKNAWLKRKAELADPELKYREQLLADDEQSPRTMQDLRGMMDVKKWEINQAAGRYIRSHEEVQHISILNRLHDFMQQHGAELAATQVPKLMGYNEQIHAVTQSAMQHSVDYLREALSVWLTAGEKINYSAQDSDILTAIGFRPDAASTARNSPRHRA